MSANCSDKRTDEVSKPVRVAHLRLTGTASEPEHFGVLRDVLRADSILELHGSLDEPCELDVAA